MSSLGFLPVVTGLAALVIVGQYDGTTATAIVGPQPSIPQFLPRLDTSRLTPEQRRVLAMRMELLRRRRAAALAADSAIEPSPSDSQTKSPKSQDDLEGENTYGFGAAAFPFLGLYGLGLGGLGVGLGPLALAGLFG